MTQKTARIIPVFDSDLGQRYAVVIDGVERMYFQQSADAVDAAIAEGYKIKFDCSPWQRLFGEPMSAEWVARILFVGFVIGLAYSLLS